MKSPQGTAFTGLAYLLNSIRACCAIGGLAVVPSTQRYCD